MDRAVTVVRNEALLDPAVDLVQLLQAVAAGDVVALRQLYLRTSAKLFGVILRILNDRSEAQDVLQEVYLLIWRNAGRFDPAKASAMAWLCVMARNKAIDRFRQRRGSVAELNEAAHVADESPSALDLVCRTQETGQLDACLEALEERPRTLIRAAFLDGQTYPQLATREGVPLGTMKSWIRRALLSLRGCLEQ